MTNEKVKSALESLLFVWGDPLDAKSAAELFDMSVPDVIRLFKELQNEYEDRGSGLFIRELDKSFQLCTNPENDDYITKLCTPVRTRRLSQASLEVLAIIAYKQPVTKTQIDSIRGIKSDKVIEGLMARNLVEELGRSTAIGRPYLYGTTREFLALFGFESLKDLPEIEDIDSLILDEDSLEEVLPDQISIPDAMADSLKQAQGDDNDGHEESQDKTETTDAQ